MVWLVVGGVAVKSKRGAMSTREKTAGLLREFTRVGSPPLTALPAVVNRCPVVSGYCNSWGSQEKGLQLAGKTNYISS